MMVVLMEDRFQVEIRSELQGERKLYGHASVFDSYAELPGHLERMDPGAFTEVLRSPDTDVRALFNHDPNQILGRQSAGNLRLSVDSQGLEFEVDLPNTTLGNDVRELVRTGLITGASFGFIPGKDKWSKIEGRSVRTHTSVRRLLDVSPVTFPAYGTAEVSMRSWDALMPVRTNIKSQLILARHRSS